MTDVGVALALLSRLVAARHPHLRFQTFDLPPVRVHAQNAIDRAGLADRIQVVSGDFFVDPLPPADVRHDELQKALQSVEREIRRVTDAIAKGGELESLLDKVRECEKRRRDLRSVIQSRAVMRSDDGAWKAGVVRAPQGSGLAGTPESTFRARKAALARNTGWANHVQAGRVYQFRREASFGALVGEAGVAQFVVPVRGFEPRFDG